MGPRTSLQYPEQIRPVPPQAIAVPRGAKPFKITGAVVKRLSSVPSLVTMAYVLQGAATATLRIFNDDSSAPAPSLPGDEKEVGRINTSVMPGFSNGWGIECANGVVVSLDQADAIGWIYLLL